MLYLQAKLNCLQFFMHCHALRYVHDEAHFLFNAYRFVWWSDHSNTACSSPAASWQCARRYIPPSSDITCDDHAEIVLHFAFEPFIIFRVTSWSNIHHELSWDTAPNSGWVKIVCKSKSGCTCIFIANSSLYLSMQRLDVKLADIQRVEPREWTVKWHQVNRNLARKCLS